MKQLTSQNEYGTVGNDPREFTATELQAAGIEKMAILKAVRLKCMDCMGENSAEVARCAITSCTLWPFRMNANPWNRREMTEEQKIEAAVRLKAAKKKF